MRGLHSCTRAGEHEHARLGGRVGGLVDQRQHRRHRRGVDDGAAAALGQVGHSQLRADDDRTEVDRDLTHQHGAVGFGPVRFAAHDACVVVQHVDAAEDPRGALQHARQIAGIGDVGPPERRRAAVLLDQLHGFVPVVLGDVGDVDRRSRRRQGQCRGPSDA